MRVFCDLEPMTLLYELNQDILKIYLHTNNELSRSSLSKFGALDTDTQAGVTTDITTLYSRGVARGGQRCISPITIGQFCHGPVGVL